MSILFSRSFKQEASRWPEWVDNDADKSVKYIEKYKEHEEIEFEVNKFLKNP